MKLVRCLLLSTNYRCNVINMMIKVISNWTLWWLGMASFFFLWLIMFLETICLLWFNPGGMGGSVIFSLKRYSVVQSYKWVLGVYISRNLWRTWPGHISLQKLKEIRKYILLKQYKAKFEDQDFCLITMYHSFYYSNTIMLDNEQIFKIK